MSFRNPTSFTWISLGVTRMIGPMEVGYQFGASIAAVGTHHILHVDLLPSRRTCQALLHHSRTHTRKVTQLAEDQECGQRGLERVC